MSAAATKWAREQKVSDKTLLATLRAIAWLADKDTNVCRQPQAAIAAEAGLKERTVRAVLVLLDDIGLTKRVRRSKGKYGRDIDEIHLAIGETFNISEATVRALRQSRRPQPAPRAAGKDSCNRHRVPLQPAPRAGESYPEDPEPYQNRESSKVDRLVLRGEDTPISATVIPLRRGAA